jgi:hypothetical protein
MLIFQVMLVSSDEVTRPPTFCYNTHERTISYLISFGAVYCFVHQNISFKSSNSKSTNPQ